MKEEKKQKKSWGRILFDIVFWLVFFIMSFVWLTDYIRVSKNKEPLFCVANKVHEFEDGTVEECIGLGYKVYDYNRESLAASRQFSVFFIGMQE